jgi:hypothetical protein
MIKLDLWCFFGAIAAGFRPGEMSFRRAKGVLGWVTSLESEFVRDSLLASI